MTRSVTRRPPCPAAFAVALVLAAPACGSAKDDARSDQAGSLGEQPSLTHLYGVSSYDLFHDDQVASLPRPLSELSFGQGTCLHRPLCLRQPGHRFADLPAAPATGHRASRRRAT